MTCPLTDPFYTSLTDVVPWGSPGVYGFPSDRYIHSVYTPTHTGQYTTLSVSRLATGSGANGVGAGDTGIIASCEKADYLTSTVEGEINGAYIVSRNGRKGDTAGLLIDTTKIRTSTADVTDTGGVIGLEMATRRKDENNNYLNSIQNLVGYMEGAGTAEREYGFCTWATSGTNYSAFFAATSQVGGAPTAGWDNLIEGWGVQNNPATRYFRVDGSGGLYLGNPASQTYIKHNTSTHRLSWFTTDGLIEKMGLSSAGVLAAQAGITPATGSATLERLLTLSTSINFGSVVANNTLSATVAVAGAVVGDTVTITPGADYAHDKLFFTGRVSSAGTVTVYAHNISTGAIDPPAQTLRITVMGF